MQIVVIAVFIVVLVCAVHSWTQKGAPRDPNADPNNSFYINLDEEK